MASPNSKLQSPETYTQRGEALRARGNVLYGEVAAGGGENAADKRSKLQRAQQLYDEALQLSCDSEKRASCCKNLGALHYLWGKVELELVPSWNEVGGGSGGRSAAPPPNTFSACTRHLREAVNFFVRAHVEGARARKSHEWMQHVANSVAGLVKWAAEQSKILVEFPEAPILQQLCKELENMGRDNLALKVEAEVLANLEFADCLFHMPPGSVRTRGQDGLVRPGFRAPLNRARRLLEILPPSSTKDKLSSRLSRLRAEMEPDDIFSEFFGSNTLGKKDMETAFKNFNIYTLKP